MSGVIGHLTAEIVGKCERAEREQGAAYVEACALVAPFSRRYADAEDVASVARVILADVMERGHVGSDAAWLAISRAAAWIGADRTGDSETPKVAAVPVGDTREALGELATDDVHAPDRIARWHAADTLGAVWDRMPSADSEDILAAMASPAAWNVNGSPNVSGIARTLGKNTTGRQGAALRAAYVTALADARSVARNLPRECLPTMPTTGHARALARDTTPITSGPASAVLRTTASGRWLTLADRSVIVDDAQAAYVLAQVDTFAAYDKGTVREVDAATLSAPTTLLPARRPAGVGIGMVHGNGLRAGAGAPEVRRVTTGKRKRDGGVGSPMVSGRTSYGSGTPGKIADAGERPTAADLLASRIARMTDKERARYDRAERRAHDAARTLRATLAAGPAVAPVAPAPVAWQYDDAASAGAWAGRG